MQEKGYVVSALKYRPSIFSEVISQKGITSTLMNAIETEELAKAYLFCGPRGVGKTTCARIFARAINAKYIPEGTDMSFNIFELDAASNNGVDDIRNLIDQVRIQPQLGKYKVYVIDEVHMLSTNAFNAFLKTLEEPPPHAIFILATTEKHKVIPTILSRCQIYDFQRIQVKDIVEHLAHIARDQGVSYEEEALHLIANKADGALRDALSLFDQMVSFTSKDLKYQRVADNLNILDHEYFQKVSAHIRSGEVGDCLLILDEIIQRGFDGLMFLLGLAEYFRNLLVTMDPRTLELLDTTDQVKKAYLEQSRLFTAMELVEMLDRIQKSEVSYRLSKNKRLLTELTLMQLCAKFMDADQVLEKKTPAARQPLKSPLTSPAPRPESIPSPVAEKPSSPIPDIAEELKPKPISAEVKEKEEPKSTVPPVAPVQSTPPASPEPDAIHIHVAAAMTEAPLNQEVMAESASPRKRRKSEFSLNELQNKHEEEQDEKPEQATDHGQEIDPVELLKAWKKYAAKMHELGKFSFYSTLENKEPKVLDDRRIQITLENEVQDSDLVSEKDKLMSFLRTELSHPGLLLESVIDIEDKGNIGFRSSKDQFQEMASKNPLLKKMRQQFDLDLEY